MGHWALGEGEGVEGREGVEGGEGEMGGWGDGGMVSHSRGSSPSVERSGATRSREACGSGGDGGRNFIMLLTPNS